jgi:hypothetical protein
MKDSKTLVVITAIVIMVAVFIVVDTAPKSQPAASSTGDTTLTVDTTQALELESYQDTIDAYDLQPATTVR